MRSIPLILSSKSSQGATPSARLSDFGNRLFDNETDAVLTTLGVKGDKLFDGTWGYDAGWRYSQLKNVQTGQQVSAIAV